MIFCPPGPLERDRCVSESPRVCGGRVWVSSYLPFRNTSVKSASSSIIRGGSRGPPAKLAADSVNARTAGGRRKRRRGRASIVMIAAGWRLWMWRTLCIYLLCVL